MRFLGEVPEELRNPLRHVLSTWVASSDSGPTAVVGQLRDRLAASLAAKVPEIEPARRPAITSLLRALGAHPRAAVALAGWLGGDDRGVLP